MFTQILFYGYAAILLISAILVVSARNTIHSALFLVLAFFTCAVIWILLRAEFLAIVLVLVYVGAVMVLFLFVVMMLNVNLEPLREGFVRNLPVGILVALIVAAEMFLVLSTKGFKLAEQSELALVDATGYSNTKAIGAVLYTDYLYAFEIAAVVLVLAMVTAIVLTMKKSVNTKRQNPGHQVRVKRKDRIRLIKMDSEPVNRKTGDTKSDDAEKGDVK